MSASTEVEESINARLRDLDEQLRPLAALEQERARLELALAALRGGPSNGEAAASTPASRAPAAPKRAAAKRSAAKPVAAPARTSRRRPRRRPAAGKQGSRASRGSNLEAIIEHVGQYPGATAGDLAGAAGISRGVVYSAVSRLTAGGRLRREPLPDGQVGYHLV